MSKAMWEEEIEERLDTILKEVKITQEMVGNCMTEPTKTAPKRATPVKQASPRQQDGETEYSTIGSLQVGEQSSKTSKIILKGTVIVDPTIREGTRKDGNSYTVANLVLNDGTGEISISFWDKFATEAMTYKAGDLVLIENVYKIDGTYNDTLKASAGKFYKMCKLN